MYIIQSNTGFIYSNIILIFYIGLINFIVYVNERIIFIDGVLTPECKGKLG